MLFYHGTDGARLSQATEQLVVRYRSAYTTPCNLHRITLDGGDAPAAELEGILKYPSFFSQPTLVVLKGAFANAPDAKHLAALLRKYGTRDKDTVILINQPGTEAELKKTSKTLWEALNELAKESRVFEPLTGARLTSWMQEFCAQRGCTLSSDSVPLVAAAAGGDTWLLTAELEKLCAWQDSGAISADSVRRVVRPATAEASVFALTDALSHRDKRGALDELDRQLSSGADPHYLLSMYAFAIRNILAVRDLADRGLSASAVAAKSGLHPFVVKKTLAAAMRFDSPALHKAHQWLSGADRSTKNGDRDATDALYDFLLSAI